MNVTPYNNIHYASLPHVDTFGAIPEYFGTSEFHKLTSVKENNYIKIESLDINTYESSEQGSNANPTDIKKLLAVKEEARDQPNFILTAKKNNSNFRTDDISLNRRNRYDIVAEGTNYMVFLHIAAAGLLYLMPESVTKWDKGSMSLSTITDKWVEDVRAGPVWDEDDWVINYIGHPYQGAAYYVFARQNGLEWKEAFLFSTIISTFMWEYGFESFAEVPSTQDLIVTPIAGSVLGEIFFNGAKRIAQNNGKVLGSKVLGDISMVLIDPAGSAVKALKRLTNVPSRLKTRTEFFYEPLSLYDSRDISSPLTDLNGQYGLRVVFTYN